MYDNTLLASPPPVPEPVEPPVVQKQSKLGIAAFIIGLAALLFSCIGFVISFGYGFSLAANNPYYNPSMIDQSSPAIMIASVLFCCSPILSLVGIGLGIAAVVQKTDKKTFGIVGLVINGLIILSICVLFIIGLIAQAGALPY
jgi:hypothetical protein